MESVDISELRNYNEELIEEWLLPFSGERVEFVISKMDLGGDKDIKVDAVIWNYQFAAYAGQQLSLVAETFSYNVPCATMNDPFRFIVDTANTKELAKALAFIIRGFCNNYEDEISMRFLDEALQYCTDAFNDVAPSAVWGLLYVAADYLSIDDDTNPE